MTSIIDLDGLSGGGASPLYRCEPAVLPSSGESVFVISEAGGGLHDEGTNWLLYLRNVGSSPETLRAYGLRVAWYLSWAASRGLNWRSPSLGQLAEWKNQLLTRPYVSGKALKQRSPETVDKWMTATTEFYRWATANGVVESRFTDDFYQQKYIPPGPLGGEMGRTVSVKAPELTSGRRRREAPPQWVERAEDRRALLAVGLKPRDRFLVDLLYATGLRGGEALSLFREDLHFLQDNHVLGCGLRGPHVHVKPNPTLNGARVKRSSRSVAPIRWVPVPVDVVASYEGYRFERVERLGVEDNPHVFVNLEHGRLGGAYTSDSMRDFFERLSGRLGFYLRPHMLRHTRATLWLHGIEGTRLAHDTVQQLLGHAVPASTMIYAHSTVDELRAAVDGVSLRLEVLG